MNYIYGKDLFSYLIEVPEKLFGQKKLPLEFIYCNKRVGFCRYTTEYINTMKESLLKCKKEAENRIAAHTKKLMMMLL